MTLGEVVEGLVDTQALVVETNSKSHCNNCNLNGIGASASLLVNCRLVKQKGLPPSLKTSDFERLSCENCTISSVSLVLETGVNLF